MKTRLWKALLTFTSALLVSRKLRLLLPKTLVKPTRRLLRLPCLVPLLSPLPMSKTKNLCHNVRSSPIDYQDGLVVFDFCFLKKVFSCLHLEGINIQKGVFLLEKEVERFSQAMGVWQVKNRTVRLCLWKYLKPSCPACHSKALQRRCCWIFLSTVPYSHGELTITDDVM